LIGAPKVGVVEDVEKIGAGLQRRALAEWDLYLSALGAKVQLRGMSTKGGKK
jgi:hypothetical protein